MQVKIYCLIDPLTLKVRYIGRTSKIILKRRLTEHVCKAVNKKRYSNYPNTHKENWICSLNKKGLTPIIKQLTIVEGWSESYILEKFLINKYKDRLLNHIDRGEGSISSVSPEQRQRISNTLKRKYQSGEINKIKEKVFYVYDKYGNYLFEKTNIKQSSIELNVSENSLSKMLNGQSKLIDKYIFSFIKTDKLEHSLKLLSVYVYDESNEMYFESYKEAAEFINVDYKKFVSSLQKKRLGKYVVSKTKINDFMYSLPRTSFVYKLINNNTTEEIIFHKIKEVAKFVGSNSSNPYIKKLEIKAKKLNFKLIKCPFRE